MNKRTTFLIWLGKLLGVDIIVILTDSVCAANDRSKNLEDGITKALSAMPEYYGGNPYRKILLDTLYRGENNQ